MLSLSGLSFALLMIPPFGITHQLNKISTGQQNYDKLIIIIIAEMHWSAKLNLLILSDIMIHNY